MWGKASLTLLNVYAPFMVCSACTATSPWRIGGVGGAVLDIDARLTQWETCSTAHACSLGTASNSPTSPASIRAAEARPARLPTAMGLCSYAGLLRFLSSNDVSETRKLGERNQQRELLAAELRGMDPLAARLRER